MEVNDVQNKAAFYLLCEMYKENMGDSPAFEVMLQSITKALEDKDLILQTQTQTQDSSACIANNDSSSSSDGETKSKIDAAVKDACKKYNVDEKLVKLIINHESRFKPNVTSCAGAQGLMQLMPSTSRALGVTNPYDIEQNVDGGTKYLRQLLDMYGNSKEAALAAYSGGPGAVNGKRSSETVEYINYVLGNYNKNL